MYLLYEGAHTLQERGEVHLGRLADQTVVRELLRVAYEARRMGEDAGRDTAVVRAGAAHLPALYEGDPGPEFPRAQRRGHPRRPAAHHDNLVQSPSFSMNLTGELQDG